MEKVKTYVSANSDEFTIIKNICKPSMWAKDLYSETVVVCSCSNPLEAKQVSPEEFIRAYDSLPIN